MSGENISRTPSGSVSVRAASRRKPAAEAGLTAATRRPTVFAAAATSVARDRSRSAAVMMKVGVATARAKYCRCAHSSVSCPSAGSPEASNTLAAENNAVP